MIVVLILSSLTVLILYVSDQILSLSYLMKSIIKLGLFTSGPFFYILLTGENVIKRSFQNIKTRAIRQRWVSLLLGGLVFASMLLVYTVIAGAIDNQQLIYEFNSKYRINKDNIIYYGLYLTFINSFLEELFFRGFIFLNLKKSGFRKLGYIFSSVLFALYHIANIQNWVSIGVFILSMTGLFIGGLIFCFLDDKQATFLNSWFVHICADAAILIIGLQIFA